MLVAIIVRIDGAKSVSTYLHFYAMVSVCVTSMKTSYAIMIALAKILRKKRSLYRKWYKDYKHRKPLQAFTAL